MFELFKLCLHFNCYNFDILTFDVVQTGLQFKIIPIVWHIFQVFVEGEGWNCRSISLHFEAI